MATQKDVYWMSSPLALHKRNKLNQKIDALQGTGAKFAKPMKKSISNEIHVFEKIEHWTLEVDGQCYQLSRGHKKDKVKPVPIDATQWYNIRKDNQIEFLKRKIGKTEKTHMEIVDEGV